MTFSPLTFDPAGEQMLPEDPTAIAAINQSMRGILETTWSDYGHAVRSVHAKSHGLLEGELRVLDGLPAELAQGIFAKPRSYPVVLRISTNPGDILDDTVSAPRGLAIKVIGVEGERLEGSEGDVTQDFILVNGPAFVAPNAAKFAASLKLLASTTDTGQAWKKGLSKALRGAVVLLRRMGVDGGPLKALGGQPMTHPLGETFYTQVPFRHGKYVAKLSVAPVVQGLTTLTDRPLDLAGKPNGLRGAVIDYFERNGGEWEVRVQLRTSPATMSIEDASVAWPEAESPYVAVARLTARPQPAWSEDRAREADDGLAFSPWHGIVDHMPLGSINRARKDAYAMSAGFRAEHNRCPMHEPRAAMGLSQAKASVYGSTPGREGRRPNTPDAIAGNFGQPLNETARRVTAGTVGGLAAGALLSAIFLGFDASGREASDLVQLKRRLADDGGSEPGRLGEQLVSHGGHLLLSGIAGAAYGATVGEDARVLTSGAAFGGIFCALAYGVAGPATGVSPPLWRDTGKSVVAHGVFHLLFGVATAVVAKQVYRRI